MLHLTLVASLTSAAPACSPYNKIASGSCAEACWGAMVGQCPVSFLIKYGGFANGTCAAAGYSKKDASAPRTVPAGPCGSIVVQQWDKATAVEAAAVAIDVFDGNVTIRKDDYPTAGECGETSMPAKDATFPVKFGGFKMGGCTTDGYTVAAGTQSECSPKVLGKQWCAAFKVYKKPSLAAKADCSPYNKIASGSCAEACWGAMVGQCPVSFLIKYGGFANGTCAAAGYSKKDASAPRTVPAGPCGSIVVQQWDKATTVEAA